MIGRKFGRLLVVAPEKSRHKRAYWRCLCDCGNFCSAMGKYLRQNKKQSCGCLRTECNRKKAFTMSQNNILPSGEAAFNLLFATYRCSAEKRGLEFAITKEDARGITKQNCFYCDKPPIIYYRENAVINGGYLYNGMDRRNNTMGYVLNNVVPCCKFCNWMKNALTEEDFLSHCSSIVDYQNRKRQAEMTCLNNK